MSSNSAGVPLTLPDAEKFVGTGFTGWRTKIKTMAKARGLGSYLDGTLPEPPIPSATGTTPQTASLPPDPTPFYSMNPSREEWTFRDSMAYALVVLNVKNPIGLGVKLDGSAHAAMKSL
ncbi:hypothetical protein C8R43DRAFT_839457, partial [Mycena crocata]